MLDALVNNGRVEEAVSFFEDMKLKGKVRPNTIMYSTIVKGYAQEKQVRLRVCTLDSIDFLKVRRAMLPHLHWSIIVSWIKR